MKAKFGAIIVAGSGKIGGHVVSKNRGGAYLRTKVTPSNPNTAAQANARAILSSLSTQWSELSDAERQSFNDAVAAFATTDIFGDIKNPSGINLFVKLNANLLQAGQSILTTAPAKVEVPFEEITAAVLDLSSLTLTITGGAALDTAAAIRFQATPPLSNGISNVKSRLRNIGYNGEINDPTVNYDNYVAKFGIPAAGSNVSLAVSAIMATGQQGTAQTIKVLIQA